jgi:DNA-binding response OmpR family regulator
LGGRNYFYNPNVILAKSTTVLLVEDDPALRSLYRATLQLEGFAVVAVEDGVDALRHLEAAPPAAVVLDLDLPRLGGRDVSRELKGRDDTRDVPIIIVTGTDASDLNPRDFACILRKPLDPDTIVSAVRRCLSKLQA